MTTLAPSKVVEIVARDEDDSATGETHKVVHYREPKVDGKYRESGVEGAPTRTTEFQTAKGKTQLHHEIPSFFAIATALPVAARAITAASSRAGPMLSASARSIFSFSPPDVADVLLFYTRLALRLSCRVPHDFHVDHAFETLKAAGDLATGAVHNRNATGAADDDVTLVL